MDISGAGEPGYAESGEKNQIFSLQMLIIFLRRLINENFRLAEPNLFPMALVGLIGFPLYFIVWQYLFPQPYENLYLRVFGVVLFGLILVSGKWPKALRRFLPVFWYFVILYSLPFFFTFMLLMNSGNHVWALSTMSAVFLMVLLLDWFSLILLSFLGSGLAWLAYTYLATDPPPMMVHGQNLAVFAFAIIASALFNYRADIIKREKMNAVLDIVSYMAHELRTPLLSISSGASGLKRYFPSLLESYEVARACDASVPAIREGHLRELPKVLDRIQSETEYSNLVIDMLLLRARPDVGVRHRFAHLSMRECVDKALARYPFRSAKEKAMVSWEDDDFTFSGSEILTIHVIFNLLKNALEAINSAGKGGVFIWIERGDGQNTLFLKDTGLGVPKETIPFIFRPFYSKGKNGRGAGIGLAFCRLVMESYKGKIHCESELGAYTQFALTFKGVS